MKKKRHLTVRLGPLGLSLLAAGITAVGFAAVSLADSGGGGSSGNGAQTFEMQVSPGEAAVKIMGPNLSAEDRQKMEDFRACMEDNGAPAPPSHLDPSDGPPKPPSAQDQQKIEGAYEACNDKLPEDLQKAGPPRIGTFECGPPPGAPQRDQGQSQSQSDRSGMQSSGSAA